MLLQESEELLLDLQQELLEIGDEYKDVFLSRMTASQVAVRNALSKLKDLVKKYPFTNDAAEIHFFKHVKPKLYALQIYQTKLFSLENNKPHGTSEDLINYYRQELTVIERYYRNNRFVYEYYRLGLDEMDSIYFIRTAKPLAFLSNTPDSDNDFATNCDYLFSKFKAYEMLSQEIISRINQTNRHPMATEQKSELKWTGDKVNLVEVIYALYFTGQINNGNTDVSAIIRFMEKHLHIDLSRAYRDFIDIRNRKASSPTRYIDQMRESIHKRIDDDLDFKKLNKNRYKSDTYK